MVMKAIYMDIHRDLLDKIVGGKYPYQSLLPSEANLVQEYGCSHNTLRRALAELARQGYVQPIHGKGVRVIYQPAPRTAFDFGAIETFKEAAQRTGLAAETIIEEFGVLTADEDLARETGFLEGDKLYRIVRVRRIDGERLILDYNYFSVDALPGLTPEIAQRSVFEYIEGELGMRVATSKRTITVEPANEVDRRYLDLKGQDYLAVVTSQTFNGDGIMFERTQSRHRPDHFSFSTVAIRE